MKLAVINCEHHDKALGRCRIIGEIDSAACDSCSQRVPIHRPYENAVAVVDDGNPQPTPIDNYTLCAERLREEWSKEWQAKLRAAAAGRNGRAYLIPREFYEEALKHRKK